MSFTTFHGLRVWGIIEMGAGCCWVGIVGRMGGMCAGVENKQRLYAGQALKLRFVPVLDQA